MDFLNAHAVWAHGPFYLYVLLTMIDTHITTTCVTLYLHRAQTHRSIKFHPVIEHLMRLWLWLRTAMPTQEWVAVHRCHHAYVDREGDPHSPIFFGIWRVVLFGTKLYHDAANDPEIIEQYGKGTPRDFVETLYHKYSLLGPVVTLVTNVWLFGAWGIGMWLVEMAWIPFFAAGVINGLGHWWGYRNFQTDDTATNLTPWGVWIGGEELHNNHHAFPSSAKFALRRWEFDIGWATIRLFQSLRMAKVLRVAPRLDVRPNIKVPDAETLKALLAIRFQAMTDFQRNVFKPALREEARAAGARLRALLPRKLRSGLADDGRWLKPAARQQLQAFVAQRPRIGALVEHRRRLAAVLEARSQSAGDTLHALQAWCSEAEASGIRVLQEFSARLKGYSLQSTRG